MIKEHGLLQPNVHLMHNFELKKCLTIAVLWTSSMTLETAGNRTG